MMSTPAPAESGETTTHQPPLRTKQPEEWTRRTQRFTPEEDQALIAYAIEQNVSINDAVRQLVFEGIERAKQIKKTR